MKVALIQLDVGRNVQENLKKAEHFVRQASGANIIVLPEAFLAPFGTPLDLNLKTFHETFSTLAPDSLLVAGTVPETVGGRTYNTCFCYKNGRRAFYRKIHLFEAHSKDVEVSEADRYFPGNAYSVFKDTPVPVGFAVCYDLRFPEQFVNLSQMGAGIIAVPAAFNYYTGRRDWELLCRARACDSQSYLLACAPAQSKEHFPVYGHSLIAAPDGSLVADIGTDEGILTAELDLGLIEKIRGELPVLKGNRNENKFKRVWF